MADSRDTFTLELRKRQGELIEQLEQLRSERDRITVRISDVVERLNHIIALIRAEEGKSPRALLPIPGEPRWKEIPIPTAVHEILKEYGGGPLHADVIRKLLEEKGRKVGKDNVVTALVRSQRRGTVERVAPNTFQIKDRDGIFIMATEDEQEVDEED